MAQISVEMTGDEAKLWQSFQKIAAQQAKVESGFKRIKQSGKQAGDEAGRTGKKLERAGQRGNEAFGPKAISMLKSFAGALGVTGGVAGAVQLVRKEYENLIEKQREAKEASIGVADAQIKALRNLGAQTAEGRDKFVAQIKGISAETGVSQRDLYLRASTAVSARGNLPLTTAMDAVRASALLVPESQGEGTAVAGAALDLSKITGDPSAQANMGLLMGIAARARVTDIGLVSQNLAPAMTSITLRGDTPQQAGALWGALTVGAADPSGRLSSTGSIKLANQLAEFLPGLKSTRARIGALQADPALYQAFMEGTGDQGMPGRPGFKWAGASIEAKMSGPIEQLLRGKGGTAEAYAQFLQQMPTIDQGQAIFEKNVAVIRGGALQQTARMARGLGTAMEGLATADQMQAQIGAMREKFAPILRQAGLGWGATKLETMRADLAGGDVADFETAFREQEIELRKHVRVWEKWTEAGIGPEDLPQRIGVAQERADVLGRVLHVLQEIRDEAKSRGNPTLAGPDQDK